MMVYAVVAGGSGLCDSVIGVSYQGLENVGFLVLGSSQRLYSPGVTFDCSSHTRFCAYKIVYLLISISSLAHSSQTLLSGSSSPGIVAQPCFFT